MLSKIAYTICAIILLYGCFGFYPKWHTKGSEATIGWDVSGYYWYLPSVFIYKDLKYQSFADSILDKYNPTPDIQQFTRNKEDGSCVMTYSSGMAFMYLPLFAAAHIIAPYIGYPPDGFSAPYQFALQVGSMLFALLGIWYFRKFLLFYFEDKVVAILLLLLVVGTNYLNYSAIDGPFTHSWLFTLYVFLLLNTHYFYKKPSLKYAIRIGLLTGLAILIRPSEMVAVLIPLLWGLNSLSINAIKKHLLFLRSHLSKIAVATGCAIAVGCIQLIYWKYASGHWLVYSYKGDGQSFTWLPPHTDVYLFSYRSGWFIYTPLMMLAWIGLFPFLKKGQNKVAVLAFLFCTLYIVSAWDTWWYGGLGGRAMIQSYPLLFIPFGALIKTMFEKKWLQWMLIPIILIFSYVNIWVTIQAHKGTGLLDVTSMSKQYYWHVVGRWYLDNRDEIEKLKDTEHIFTGQPRNPELVYNYNYENDTSIQMPAPAIEGIRSGYVCKDKEYSARTSFTPNIFNKWMRVSATVRTERKEWTEWKMPQFSVRFLDANNKEIKTNILRLSRFVNERETKKVYLDIQPPANGYKKIEIFLWNPGSEHLLMIDNIKVWSFNE